MGSCVPGSGGECMISQLGLSRDNRLIDIFIVCFKLCVSVPELSFRCPLARQFDRTHLPTDNTDESGRHGRDHRSGADGY
jgi:hypothetical protein